MDTDDDYSTETDDGRREDTDFESNEGHSGDSPPNDDDMTPDEMRDKLQMLAVSPTDHFDEVRELLRRPMFWQPTYDLSAVLKVVEKAVVPPDERLMKVYNVISVNRYDQEQERVLIITDRSYARVKFNHTSGVVERFHRIPLEYIDSIQFGQFFSTSKLLSKSNTGDEDCRWGFRVFTRDAKSGATKRGTSKHDYFRTFRPRMSPDHVVANGLGGIAAPMAAIGGSGFLSDLELTREICYAFQSAVKLHNPGVSPEELVYQEPLDRRCHPAMGMWTAMYNKLGMGITQGKPHDK